MTASAAKDSQPEIVDKKHRQAYRPVQIETISANCLPRTGISRNFVGDFWEILARVAGLWSLETTLEITKLPHFAGISRKMR